MQKGAPVIYRQGAPVPGNWKLVPTAEVGENASATVLIEKKKWHTQKGVTENNLIKGIWIKRLTEVKGIKIS